MTNHTIDELVTGRLILDHAIARLAGTTADWDAKQIIVRCRERITTEILTIACFQAFGR